MKKLTIEQELIAARPDDFKINQKFVEKTLDAIKNLNRSETFSEFLGKTDITKKEHFIMKLKHLPTASLVAIIAATILITSGAVYAAVQFVPDLIKILSKNETQRGTTEYYVPEFENCADPNQQKTSKFELKKDAPKFSDGEVTKIIQAKCEMGIINQLVKDAWPPEKVNANNADSQLNFIVSPEFPTRFDNIENGQINTYYDNEGAYKSSHPISKTIELKAYSTGRQIQINEIKKGNAIVLVARENEQNLKEGPSESFPKEYIGIIKLSLPFEYYEEKQMYITDINDCFGNPGENCPNTGYIDVFPAGEGMGGNEYLTMDESKEQKEITGEVISLDSEILEIKSSSGAIFKVMTPKDSLKNYNSTYAKNYHDGDASLKLGSRINVRYFKSKDADNYKIAPYEIEQISLLIDAVDYKQEPLKQY